MVYSLSLEQRNPPVAKFLSQLAMDPATVNGWIVEIGHDGRDPQDVAEEWVAENMDIVNEWIKQSAFEPKAFAVDPYQQQMQIPQRLHQAQAKCTDWRQNTAWVVNRDVVRDLAATGITSLHPV